MDTCPLERLTVLGYSTFRCRCCRRRFNERTGTAFNATEFSTDVVWLVVRRRLRDRLSLRDLSVMLLERGFEFTDEAVREWGGRIAPLLTDALRRERRGPSWYVDETYVKISGRWCCLYGAIDRDGNLVDCRLSDQRDLGAAWAYFNQALAVTGTTPDHVTTEGHDAHPRTLRDELGDKLLHRTSRYLHMLIEQDHCGIKQRYRPMRGFGSFTSAAHFCRAHDELRNYYRPVAKRGQVLSLADRRGISQAKTTHLTGLLLKAA